MNTLTYWPTHPTRDVNYFRKISITVNERPGLKVVTRHGYFDSRAPARLASDGGASRRLQAEASRRRHGNDGLRRRTYVAGSSCKYARQVYVAYRRRGALLDEDHRHRSAQEQADPHGFNLRQKRQAAEDRCKDITVKAPGTVPPTGRLDRAVTLGYQVPPDPNAVRARFVIRVDRTGRMGTADADLLHPATATAPVQPASAPSAAPITTATTPQYGGLRLFGNCFALHWFAA